MSKTLYVSDLDGTLLNSQSVLSDNTVNILKSLILDDKALFTVATARTPATVVELMACVPSVLPYIVMSGAALWDNATQTYADVRRIHDSVVETILPIYNAHGINPFIYRRHGSVLHAHHVEAMTEEERSFILPRVTTPLKSLVTSSVLDTFSADEAVLMFALGDFARLRAAADEVERTGVPCSQMCYHDIFDPNRGILDIYAAGVSKAEAVRRMAERTGADRVVVFGDNLNDLPMMRVATHSVAVSNAFDEVRRQADEVIGSNGNDAVARWIADDIARNR